MSARTAPTTDDRTKLSRPTAFIGELFRAIRAGEKTFEAAAQELASQPGFKGGIAQANDTLHSAFDIRHSSLP